MTNCQFARVFSGIQPTGIPHLGNYFGAIAKWIRLTQEPGLCKSVPTTITSNQLPNQSSQSSNIHNTSETLITPIFSIVDIHAYTSRKVAFGQEFYDNILSTTASLLALGLDPNKCILFRQSDLLEHNYLDNVLDNFVSPSRLTRMTQFKEKSSKSKSNDLLLNGLLNYPVLQAADILLYKANLVPVGEDQIQHIELARDLARKFNTVTNSQLFPEPNALLEDCKHARRIKSLRDPSKKMSKSDIDTKSFIEVVDEPEIITEKIKKAITDSTSAVYFDAENRPGVSNLMRIHSLATGDTLDHITKQHDGVETAQYKLILADILIDKFKPVREAYKRVRCDHAYLESVLKLGQDKAKPLAHETVTQVKHMLGSYRNM